MDKNAVLVGGAILFRDDGGKEKFLLIKETEDSLWEFPKVIVRKGESSVRSVLRIMGERCGLTTKVLEEAGRSTGVLTANNKASTQKLIYYLMILKSKPVESVGYAESVWAEFSSALKKISSKKEQMVFKNSKEVLKTWKKFKKSKHLKDEEEEEAAAMAEGD